LPSITNFVGSIGVRFTILAMAGFLSGQTTGG
jgi:hypothetical protein